MSDPNQPRQGEPVVVAGQRELILVTAPGLRLQVRDDSIRAADGRDLGPMSDMLSPPDVRLAPLFGPEERLRAAAVDTPTIDGVSPEEMEALLADMARFFHVDAPDDRLDDLAEQFRDLDMIEAAYVKPAAELATVAAEADGATKVDQRMAEEINAMTPSEEESPPVSPNFTTRQAYLGPAPAGVDAQYAWTVPGGRGTGVRATDCEWGWRFTHEDLLVNQGGVVVGTATTTSAFVQHGTAVLGEISGDVNTIGITGIAPEAVVTGAAFSLPTASVIRQAADRLSAGDLILLEIHRPGPNATGAGQFGYIAIEWWPDDYLAIRYAANKGILVVEAAGNGAQNLDDAAYDTPAAGFPAWWRNPFRRSPLDSGAILVGAGAPPPGTHGRDWGPDRSRLDFSNYGSAVDVQGWGREVTSTGYGDLQGGSAEDAWYTDQFSGTSSASPMIVGVLACVQGVLRSAGRIRLGPGRARQLLRSTGSPQQAAPGRPATQRIGNRPNLRQLIPLALAQGGWFGVQFRGVLNPGDTQRWFTFNWPAHWHVVWTVVPTSPRLGAPQVEWTVRIERATDYYVTYWIDIKNLVSEPVYFEARYAVLGW